MIRNPAIAYQAFRVRFQDCDPFGHLNNATYLEYFLNAREDHLLKHFDFDLHAWIRDEQCAWVVHEHRIRYLRPALANEIVQISSSILSIGGSKNLVEFAMWDEEGQTLKALDWAEFYYIDLRTQRPTRYPERILEHFNPFVLEEYANFDQRTRELQKLAAEDQQNR